MQHLIKITHLLFLVFWKWFQIFFDLVMIIHVNEPQEILMNHTGLNINQITNVKSITKLKGILLDTQDQHKKKKTEKKKEKRKKKDIKKLSNKQN